MENDNNNALGDLLNNSTVVEHINSSNRAPSILNITSVAEDFETQDLDYPSFDEETNYDRPIPLTVENFTLLPGEIVLMNTKNVVNLSLTTTVHRIGTLYQTNYQMFFIDDSTRQMVTTIPNGQVMEIKKLKGHVTVKYHDGSNTPSTSNVNNNNNSGSNLVKSSSIEPLNLEKQPSQNEHLTINNNNNNEQSSSTSSNTLATSTTTNPSNSIYQQQQQLLSPQPQQSTSRKDKLSKSVSTPIGLNNHSNSSPLLTSATTTTTSTTTTTTTNNGNSNSSTAWYSNGVSEKALILEIRCKDFMITRFCLPFNERGNEAYDLMNKLTMVDNNLQLLFSYKFSPFKGVVQPFDGWLFYDPVEEYTRQGLIGTGSQWRLSKINSKFEICSTYPQLLMIPFSISDYLLNKSALYRNKNRFPVCTWRHKTTLATLSRSSTPLNGLSKNRCEEDELLIQAIRKCTPNNTNSNNSSTNNSSLYIYDIKSKSGGASGALSLSSSSSTEDISHYLNCTLESVSLSNIHELRESQLKLFKVVRNWNEKKGWTEIQNTGWLQNTSKLLSCTKRILQHIHTEGMSVLIHCIDGTDRTSQVSSLVQLCADPYYRTIKGFIILVCKEWISFGHKFMTRNGISNGGNGTSPSSTKQSSPIFLQFIDAVWQLTKQFPTSFEFSDKFLSVILYHLNSNLFGTFLYDCEKDRQTNKLSTETESLWTLLLGASKNSSLLNQLYNCNNKEVVVNTNVDGTSTTSTTTTSTTTTSASTTSASTNSPIKMNESIVDGVLFPNSQGVQLWSDYYLKWKTPNKASRKSNTLITQSLGVSYVNGDLIVVQKKRRSKRSSTNGGISSSKHHRKSISGGGGKSSDDLTKSSSKVKTRSSKRKSTIQNTTTSPIVEKQSIDSTNTTNTTDDVKTTTTTTSINNDKIISTPVIIIQEQDNCETNKQIPNNQMDSSIEICKKEDRTYSMESEHQSTAISPIKQQTLEPILESDPTTAAANVTTTTTSHKLDKEIRKQEKEKRKQEKEKKAKDRLERKEKKREAKEKEQREKEQLEQKPKADITVVLQSPSKSSKAMGALTMPVRGSKSRISIFSSPLATTPNNSNSPTLIPNLNNVENTSFGNTSGSNSGNASIENSPNLTSSNQQPPSTNINNFNNTDQQTTSFSKRIFKTLRGTKSLSQPTPQQQA